MKIAVISDIHDNLANLRRIAGWCRGKKIQGLICPGDVTNRETLLELKESFPKAIFLVRGNAAGLIFNPSFAVWETETMAIDLVLLFSLSAQSERSRKN